MLDTFPAAAVFALVVAGGLAALYAVTVVPFVLALSLAERRGLSTGRWGGLALLGVVGGLAVAGLLVLRDAHPALAALGLALVFTAPVALVLRPSAGDDEDGPRSGRAGRHESPV